MTGQIEKIKKEVWNELRDYDVNHAIEITFKITAHSIFEDFEKIIDKEIDPEAKLWGVWDNDLKELKKKWGVEDE